MHTKHWFQNLKGRIHLEDSGIDRRVIINMDIKVIGFQDVD